MVFFFKLSTDEQVILPIWRQQWFLVKAGWLQLSLVIANITSAVYFSIKPLLHPTISLCRKIVYMWRISCISYDGIREQVGYRFAPHKGGELPSIIDTWHEIKKCVSVSWHKNVAFLRRYRCAFCHIGGTYWQTDVRTYTHTDERKK